MYSKGGRDYKETGRQIEVIENYPEGVKNVGSTSVYRVKKEIL
jgi:hypothetical protein